MNWRYLFIVLSIFFALMCVAAVTITCGAQVPLPALPLPLLPIGIIGFAALAVVLVGIKPEDYR